MRSLLALAALCVPAYAGNCHVQQARVVHRNQVVVANAIVVPQNFIAVPVAQPIALPSYYAYQALPQYASGPAYGSAAVGHQGYRDDPGEQTNVRTRAQGEATPPPTPEPPVPMTLLGQHCQRCHRPEGSAWGKTHFDVTGELSADERLHAIQRVLSDDVKLRMPRGKEIDADTRGLLIQELSKP